MVRTAVAVAAVAGMVGLGCPSLGGYFCQSDDDCDRGGQDGICLVDNACAYPDASGTCPSGFVRSPNADRLPGECVPGGDLATGSGDGNDTIADTIADTGMAPTTGPTDDPDDTGAAGCGEQLPIIVDTARISPGVAVPGYPLVLRIDDPSVVATLQTAASVTITDDAGSLLPHETQEAAADPDVFAAWVRLPPHDADAALTLQLRWGTGEAAPDATAVWDAYAGVWHFDTPPNGVDQDTRPNAATPGEPGQAFGTMTAEQNVRGVVGGSLRFDGIDDAVDVQASYVGTLQSYTISMWARYEGATERQDSYFQRLNGHTFHPRCWRADNVDDPALFCQYAINGMTYAGYTGYDHPNDTWMHFAMVRDAEADRTEVFADGQSVFVQDDEDGALATGRNAFQIGSGEWGSFPGTIDEVRVATAVIPASWFVADVNHQPDPTAAIALGTPEPLPCD